MNWSSLRNLPRNDVYLAVHRFEEAVYYRRLVAENFRLLSALQAGVSLEEAIEAAFEHSRMPERERPPHLESGFRFWITMGSFLWPDLRLT
jgi:hypothetical protein